MKPVNVGISIVFQIYFKISSKYKKKRIRETKHLSTDADSSTDAIGGWTKNTTKPDFFEKRKKSPKTQKIRNVQKYDKISDTPFDQRSLIHWESQFPPCFIEQRIQFFQWELRFLAAQNKRSYLRPALISCAFCKVEIQQKSLNLFLNVYT